MKLGISEFQVLKSEAIGGWTRTTLLNTLMKYEDKVEILGELNEEGVVYHGIENALVGWAERFGMPPVAIYDYDKTIACLMEQNSDADDPYEAAIEWYDVNTLGGWVGESTPIFIHTFQKEQEICRFSTVLKSWWTKTVTEITVRLAICGRLFRKGGS